MDAKQMSRFVAEFFDDANELQWKKNRDYHPDNVAFLEILRTACETGITVEQDLWAKIRKQYIALRGYMIDGRLESEPPRSRMMDIAVYMGMSAVWDAHKIQILKDASLFIDERTFCEYGLEMCSPKTPPIDVCDRCRFQLWIREKLHAC